MSTAPPRFSLPAYPEWEGDRDHPRYAECDDECRFCGRPIRQAKSFQVHEVGGGGYLAPVGEDYTDGNSDLGWWSIGSGCAKGIPAAFKEKHTT